MRRNTHFFLLTPEIRRVLKIVLGKWAYDTVDPFFTVPLSPFSRRSKTFPTIPFVKTSAPQSPTEKWEFLPLTDTHRHGGQSGCLSHGAGGDGGADAFLNCGCSVRHGGAGLSRGSVPFWRVSDVAAAVGPVGPPRQRACHHQRLTSITRPSILTCKRHLNGRYLGLCLLCTKGGEGAEASFR